MNAEQRLRAAASNLRIDRVLERRKAVETLRNLIDTENVTKDINGSTWKSVFVEVHDCILKEFEKYDPTKGASSNAMAACSHLLHKTLAVSSKHKNYIDCNKVLDCCFEVINCSRYFNVIGTIYITVLNKHILPYSYHLERITPKQWEDLLSAIVQQCRHDTIDHLTLSQLLLSILREGVLRCHLVLPIRNNLNFFESLFTSANNEKKHHLQENYLQIAILIVENVGAESRIAVGNFTEIIVQHALKYYEQTSITQKNNKKVFLFKFFRLCIILHHPKGKTQNEPGSFANNWELWNQSLLSMYKLVVSESIIINQHYGKIEKSQILSIDKEFLSGFIEFASEICYQVFQGQINNEPVGETSSTYAKRTKLEYHNFFTFSQVIENLTKTFHPWISILSDYVKKFGQLLRREDKYKALMAMFDLSKSEEKSFQHHSIFECIINIYENVEISEWNEKYSDLSLDIWNMAIRKTSTQNNIFEYCHKIIQLFLKHDHFHPPLNSLIKSYFDRNMPCSNVCLETLIILFRKYNVKIKDESIRLQIAKWVLENYRSLEQINVSNVLFQLCTKENINETSKISLKIPEDYIFHDIFESMENFMLISDFELSLLNNENCEVNKKMENNSFTIYPKVFALILETTISNLSKTISDVKEFDSFVPAILIDFNNLLKYLSFVSTYVQNDYVKILNNIKVNLYESFEIINNKIPPYLDNLSDNDSNKLDTLKNLGKLYENGYHSKEVSSLIRDHTGKEIIEMLISLGNKNENEHENDDYNLMDSEVISSSNHKLKFLTIDIICNYCCENSNYKNSALEFILNPDFYDFTLKSDIDLALDVISFMLKNFEDDIPLGTLLILLQNICKRSYRDNEDVSKILSLLFDMLKPISLYGNENNKNNCIIMLKSFLVRCKTHFYSIKVMGQALKCLSWILISSNLPSWGRDLENTFMECLCNDIFSIRLYSCYCSSLYISNVKQEKFKNLTDELHNVFTLDDVSELATFVKSDEGVNRTATVLYCLSHLSLSSSVWDHFSIATILEIGYVKNIDIKLITKVINIINKSLNYEKNIILENIEFFINCWINKDLPIEKFPYTLTSCTSIDDFYCKYKNILIAQEAFLIKDINKRNVISILIQEQNMSYEKIISECIPNLIILCLLDINYEHFDDSLDLKTVLNQKLKINVDELQHNVFSEVFISNVDNILFGLIKGVYDDNQIKKFFLWNKHLPSVVEPSVSVKNFDCVLKYFTKCLPISLSKKIYVENPSILQNLLLRIWASIESHHTLERKLTSLYHYWIFCKILDLTSDLNTFICNFVIRSLLAIVNKYKNIEKLNFMSVAACRVLSDLLETMLPSLSEIITNMIPSIVSTICQFVQDNALAKKISMRILSLIFLEHRQCFEQLFCTLDPLPKTEIFAGINSDIEVISTIENYGLEKHIEKFLHGNVEYRSEGLKLLYDMLLKHRDELIKMFENLNRINGFSEDCSTSKLHKLIAFLFKISSNANDENASLLASKCLGEIGSCDLRTLVIKTPVDNIVKDPKSYFTYTFFSEIHNMIFDSNPSVIRATTKALVRLFSFLDGSAVLENFNADVNLMMIPFLSTKKSLVFSNFQISSVTFNAYLSRSEIWYNFDYKEHNDWIIEIVVSALNSFSPQQCFLLDLIEIFQLKHCVAENCFPSLIGLILSISNPEQVRIINLYIQNYFDRYYKATFISDENSEYNNKINYSEPAKCFSKASVKCMLNLIQFIRLQMKHYDWEEELLTFNYLPIAWAAFHTGSYFSSILYGELWCNNLMDNIPPINPDAILSYDNSQNMLSIMRKSYRMIGDLDALQGCGLGHLSNLEGRRRHHIFSGHFSDAFLLHDLLLSSKNETTNANFNSFSSMNDFDSDKTIVSNISSAKNFAQCLHASGLYHLSDKYMQSYGADSNFDEIKYDCFWRLGDWSLHVDPSSLNSKTYSHTIENKEIWSAYHYMCLKNLLDESGYKNDNILSNCLKQARFYINSNCELNIAFDNCEIIYEYMKKLQLLQEIEDFKKIDSDNQIDLINRWSLKNLVSFSNFKNVEPILSQRLIILNDLLKKSQNIQVKASIVELHLEYADLALKSDSIQSCKRWINMASHTVRSLVNSQNDESHDYLLKLVELTNLAEGKAAWKNGHIDIAFHLMKTIINKKNIIDRNVYACSLITYGSWMVETRRESAQDILNKYLMESLEILREDGELSTKLEAYLIIAKFADGEYKQINSYMKSPAFVNKLKCMERCKETVETLREKHTIDLSKNEKKAMLFNERQKQIDETEISNTKFELTQYLHLALRYYLLTLSEGNEDDFPAFRVISLWLDNPLDEFCDDDKTLLDYFKLIPSRKFLTLLPQLAPRLNHVIENSFQDTLYELIKKCAIEHPHHTLPILLALKLSNKDSEHQNSKDKNNSNETYTETTKKMLNQLCSSNSNNLKKIIIEMDHLYTSLISLANYKAKLSNVRTYKIPRSETLNSMKNLQNIVVPTINLPISKTGDYKDIISIVSFSNEFMHVGGINTPKKMICKGSDGIQRNILLKGEDDIRQDAVMQQVFGIVNKLLANDDHTQKSRLKIRTYKVVPLSRHSGIIEWCDGTEPFGKLLTGNNGSTGYHGCRPNDMPARDARQLMMEKIKSTNDEKLKAFNFILSKFKPVFHHFFILNFLNPAIWYERRLAYMRSVATSSMIGYILGLGDRHVQNILIDTSTAEVIHIDFGIAFEQGRLQPTPETVPFRLTQDMVAGFGCTGMEGVFRRSCEKTMDVLKSNQEMLLTILEVLLYDPLYIWTISEEQACKNQNIITSSLMTPSTSISMNYNNEGSGSEAERALIRIKNKLEGTEFGSILATAGQVARLLQQATDVKNLSRLYPGWQPYL